jgi:hypothetical protein
MATVVLSLIGRSRGKCERMTNTATWVWSESLLPTPIPGPVHGAGGCQPWSGGAVVELLTGLGTNESRGVG